jgi:enamine deaminase RidA (YjgF/YER057c/UK114 family)
MSVDCKTLDEKLDHYLDGELDQSLIDDIRIHAVSCSSCEQTITAFQQTRAMISTAVADLATAVDVSGFFEEVESRMAAEQVRSWRVRATGFMRAAGREIAGTFGTPARAAVWSGAVAAVAVALFLAMTGTEPERERLAATSSPVRVDNLEAGRGYSVATWSHPRTGTRVFWARPSDGFSVATASHAAGAR